MDKRPAKTLKATLVSRFMQKQGSEAERYLFTEAKEMGKYIVSQSILITRL